MTDSEIDKLIELFPDIYCRETGYWVRSGWFDLLLSLSIDLSALAKRHQARVRCSEVKQKFGRMIFSPKCDDEVARKEIFRMVRVAELESLKICEHCGRPGVLGYSLGSFETLCEECGLDYAPVDPANDPMGYRSFK